jgi:hypothetical protein
MQERALISTDEVRPIDFPTILPPRTTTCETSDTANPETIVVAVVGTNVSALPSTDSVTVPSIEIT